jgi:hypothetical protein
MFVVLSTGMLTALTATTMSLAIPVYAGEEKHCEDNEDNNCNDTRKTQKIKEKNECEIENYNKDESEDNDNLNELVCINEASNLKDVLQLFGGGDGLLDESAPE